jgi:hypothetical protein
VAGDSARAQVCRQASFRKAASFAAAREGTPGVHRAFCSRLPREEAMRDRFKFKSTPERLSLFAMVLVMVMFGAGIFYQGASFKGQQRTEQLAAADWYP